MKYAKNYIPVFILTLVTLFLFSCSSKSDKPTAEAAKEENEKEEAENSGVITLSQLQMNAVGIKIGTIEEKNLSEVVKATGQLEVPPQNRADVNVLTGGVIQKINVLEGQRVSKGQVVALLENPELIKLQQDYLTTKRGFSYIQSEYERQQELKKADAGTGRVYQQAEANYRAELGRIIGLEKQLQQFGISAKKVAAGQLTRLVPVKAPISGTVGQISVNTGAYADASNRLMEIIDTRYIHCDLVVYEKDLFKVKKGQQVNFTLTNQNNASVRGEIYGINKSFENESKGIVVHAIIKNARELNLIPGMYVSALVNVGSQTSQAVPVDAVVRSQGKNYIYVVANENKEETVTAKREEKETEKAEEGAESEEQGQSLSFRQVEVVTGVAELGYVQIKPLEELPKDSKIITKGAFYVFSKSSGGEEEEE